MQANNYDTDFYGWSAEQADLLKKGQFEKLDIINLIDEVESLGGSEKNNLISYLTIHFLHLLKKKYQPVLDCRSWDISIRNSKDSFIKKLHQNPGLKSKLDEIFEEAYRNSRVEASKETGFDESIFPKECPWTKEEVINASE